MFWDGDGDGNGGMEGVVGAATAANAWDPFESQALDGPYPNAPQRTPYVQNPPQQVALAPTPNPVRTGSLGLKVALGPGPQHVLGLAHPPAVSQGTTRGEQEAEGPRVGDQQSTWQWAAGESEPTLYSQNSDPGVHREPDPNPDLPPTPKRVLHPEANPRPCGSTALSPLGGLSVKRGNECGGAPEPVDPRHAATGPRKKQRLH